MSRSFSGGQVLAGGGGGGGGGTVGVTVDGRTRQEC